MKKTNKTVEKERRFRTFNSIFMFTIIALLTIIVVNLCNPINASGGDYVIVEAYNEKILELETKIQELENRVSELEQSVVRTNNKIDKVKSDLLSDIKDNTNRIRKIENRELRFYEGILKNTKIYYVVYGLYREIK